MKKNIKHSPIKEQLLRRPGQSLDEKIQDILYDKILPYILITIFLFTIASIQWLEQVFNTHPNPLLWTFLALVFVGYSLIKIGYNWSLIKNARLGRDGERFVGQELEKLTIHGYHVFHDVISPERNFNIDHILVGSAGVFCIETKTISKQRGAQKISYKNGLITYDGFKPSRDPIRQVLFQSSWLKNFLLEEMGQQVEVKPVLIFPGWFVESENRDVWILNERALPKFLEGEEARLNSEQVALISLRIKVYIQRNVPSL